MANPQKHETFLVLRVVHDDKLTSKEKQSYLADQVGGRAHTMDGVYSADAQVWTPVVAAGEGEPTNAHFRNPADGVRFIQHITAPYHHGVRAAERSDGENANPYPSFTVAAAFWAYGWRYGRVAAQALVTAIRDGHTIDWVDGQPPASENEPPRLHAELMKLALQAPQDTQHPNAQVENARY